MSKIIRRHHYLGYFISCASVSLCVPTLASAQTAEPQNAAQATSGSADAAGNGLADIVVTAQKRAQTAMTTPLSVSALGADDLAARQVTAISDLVRVSPGINIGQQWGQNRLFIRGIGLSTFAIGADPSSAFYVDGVYVGSAAAQLTSFYDIARVEVVRGPQGTLYGRNATGGAVNLISQAPTDKLSGYLDTTVGNYNQRDITGAISGPLTADGTLKARLAVNFARHDGYGRNVTNGEELDDQNYQSGRLTLQWDPSATISMRLIGEYFNEKDNAFFTNAFGAYPGFSLTGKGLGGNAVINSRNVASAIQGPVNNRRGFALTHVASVDMGGGLSLQTTTGYRYFRRKNLVDIDNTDLVLADGSGNGDGYEFEKTRQFSEEVQLSYKGGGLDAVAGIFYYHQNLQNDTYFPFSLFGPGLLYDETGVMKINAYAGYAQATYTVVPHVRLTGGVRYSVERRNTDGIFYGVGAPPAAAADGKTWKSFTPKGGIEVDLAKDTMVYASVTKGFKSGTFNVGQINPPINPEKITAYEAGIKARLFDRHLDLTAAGFIYDFKDLQVTKIIGISQQTVNAAKAKIRGLEFSARARLNDMFSLDGDLTYLDPKFTEFVSINPLTGVLPGDNLTGNQLPGATKWAANASAEIQLPVSDAGTLKLRGGISYRSRVFFNEFNNALNQPGNTKVDASLRFDSANDHWYVSVWGKNLANKLVIGAQTMGVGAFGFPVYGGYEAPRTFGVTLGVKI